MKSQKNGERPDLIGKIPKWAWLLISLTVALILWKFLSVNEKTSRSFPDLKLVFGAIQTMLDRGVLFKDIGSSMVSICTGFLFGFSSANCIFDGMVSPN